MKYVTTGASLSHDMVYRYSLWRQWGDGVPSKRMVFLMFNPSIADSLHDDPTIRRCVGYADREGCTYLEVVNLFAYRATNPTDLVRAYKDGVNIIGSSNMEYVHKAVSAADVTVLAWGANADRLPDPFSNSRKPTLVGDVRTMLWLTKKPVYCLGITASGQPLHPLRLHRDQPLQPFTFPREIKRLV